MAEDAVPVELLGVRVEVPTNSPIVLLRELSGLRRYLSIFIGTPEATAIAFALEGVATPRPLTHDLLQIVLETLGVELERVTVTELREQTYFAELTLRNGDESYVISCRPSDAVALAARVGCPIFASLEVLDVAGYLDDEASASEDELDPDEVVEEFRHFIEQVNPDDFAS